MAVRKNPLITGNCYHVYNKSFDFYKIFSNKNNSRRAMQSLFYYQFLKPPMRYSYFSRLNYKKQVKKLNNQNKKLVDIICFCFMPTHFHLLIKQKVDGGISKFLGKFSNSYTHYFNTKNSRIGPIFQGPFKSVEVSSEQQLLHLSRYIHLNPYSSKVVKNKHELTTYPYSSLKEYIDNGSSSGLCSKSIILNQFGKNESYKDFVLGRAKYQQDLQQIKKLLLD